MAKLNAAYAEAARDLVFMQEMADTVKQFAHADLESVDMFETAKIKPTARRSSDASPE
jgi:hypothetical protein